MRKGPYKKAIRFKDLQPEDRPLQRLINKGPQALSNPELLAVLLGKDFKWKGYQDTAINVAHRVFKKYNIKQLSQASIGELEKIFGIGKIRAAHIQAIFELARRLASYTNGERPEINEPKDVFRILGPEMQSLKQECVKVVLLDSRNRVIKCEEVTKGSLDANVVHPREVFRSAIENNAYSIILVHNHPSGDPEPSNEDIKITKEIVKAGKILGIEVKDHIIIGDNRFASLKNLIS